MDAFEILVVILSVVLAILLILTIIATVLIIKLLKKFNIIAKGLENIVENVEDFTYTLKKTIISTTVIKSLLNTISLFKRKK